MRTRGGPGRGVRVVLGAVLGMPAVAAASPYWVAWEGDDFPENQGWSRNWGNWQGQYQGPGAVRTLNNGVLTYDSLYDSGVFDINELHRPMDPGPGELFVIEWRVFTETDASYLGDTGFGFGSDTAMVLGITIRPTYIRSDFEGVILWVKEGVFHDYRVTSWDMQSYSLYIDGQLRHTGSFWQSVGASQIAWGDGSQNFTGGSLHHWDYFRIGVVPEPGSAALICTVAFGIQCVSRRSR